MKIRDKVVLVDKNDNQIGVMEKMEAHTKGELHRAFSIFIFNSLGELLLQRRALSKYHSPGLWTNTCCSHPLENEEYKDGAIDRLMFEMGIECNIKEVFSFIYKAKFSNGLIEHEYDRVFVGNYDGDVEYNVDEVHEIKWIELAELYSEIEKNSDEYTEWFKILMNKNIETNFLNKR